MRGWRKWAFFFKVIKAAFSQRRKTLANSLSSSLKADKSIITAAVEKAGLRADIRPEKLTLEEMAAVSNELYPLIG